MPPDRHVAVVACMDARPDVYRLVGIRPPFAFECVLRPRRRRAPVMAHIHASPFIRHENVRGYVYESTQASCAR